MSARLAALGAVIAVARRSTIAVIILVPAWRSRPPAKATACSIVQSCTLTTNGHGRSSGVNVG